MGLRCVPSQETPQAAAELAAIRGGSGRGSSGAGDCAKDGGAMNELQQAERWHLHYLSRAWYWEKQREASDAVKARNAALRSQAVAPDSGDARDAGGLHPLRQMAREAIADYRRGRVWRWVRHKILLGKRGAV